MKQAPIISLHFNRPDHSLRALESLSRNYGASDSELFIFCDGPRNEQDLLGVDQVRQVVKSQQWCGQVHVIEREKNYGCFQNTVSAVSEICEQYGKVIFCEDDSLVSPYFLNYMNRALEIYQDEPLVMQVSAYMWPLEGDLPETFFLKVPNVWTFATWQRAWIQYHTDGQSLLNALQQRKLEQEFTFQGNRPWLEILENEISGAMDDWSIYWTAIVFLNGLSLFPRQSLVRNIGFDGTGLHYNFSTTAFDTVLLEENITDFTDIIEQDILIYQKLVSYFESLRPRRGNLWERGIYKLKKMLK